MSQLNPISYLSPEEYLAGERLAEKRHEYVDGEIHAMSGASRAHNRITLNIAFHLRGAARGGPCGVYVNDMKVRVQQGRRFYYPDVALSCLPEEGDTHYIDAPCLIAEVLSESTEKIDRREKWLAYRAIPELRYYLLVDSRRPYALYYHRRDDGQWEAALLEPGETLIVECPGLRAELRHEELFEDVLFDPPSPEWVGEPPPSYEPLFAPRTQEPS